MFIYIAGERCPNIMIDSPITTVELVESPAGSGDKEDVIPGGDPFTTNEDETDIIINLQSRLYVSGFVTKIAVTPVNVETITIYIENEDGDWVPLNQETPGSPQPQEFLAGEMPVVLEPGFEDATKVKITLTRANDTLPMSAEVDIWACLESG